MIFMFVHFSCLRSGSFTGRRRPKPTNAVIEVATPRIGWMSLRTPRCRRRDTSTCWACGLHLWSASAFQASPEDQDLYRTCATLRTSPA
jgi:hypothetical protein